MAAKEPGPSSRLHRTAILDGHAKAVLAVDVALNLVISGSKGALKIFLLFSFGCFKLFRSSGETLGFGSRKGGVLLGSPSKQCQRC